MRKQMMELQGLKSGPLSANDTREGEGRLVTKEAEDDYLAGPLTVESYVVFRVRPLIDSYEKLASRLSQRLKQLEIAAYAVNLLGVVLATSFVNSGEWLSLTVAVVALLGGTIEFGQLKSRLVALNLSLAELNELIVWWDSLSVVQRRPDVVRSTVVQVTERAVHQVVDALTTAASSAQKSVEREMAHDVVAGGEDS